jgi:hypothetical protein
VSGSGDRTVRVFLFVMKVWDAETGRCLNVLSNDSDIAPITSPSSTTEDSGVTSVAIRPTTGLCVAAVPPIKFRELWINW